MGQSLSIRFIYVAAETHLTVAGIWPVDAVRFSFLLQLFDIQHVASRLAVLKHVQGQCSVIEHK